MAETYSAGIVTAYGAAVRGGYTGTYEQWCQDMAQLGDNVSEVREKTSQVEQTAQEFTQTIIPAAIQSVENEGTAQVGAVEAAGAAQVQAVETAGTTQTGNVNTAGAAQVQAVNDEGVLKVGAVEAAGAAQVQAVNDEGVLKVGAVEAAGAAQVQAVEDAGDDVTEAVEAVGTAAMSDIDTAKTSALTALRNESFTQQTAIQQKGETTRASIPDDYTALSDEVVELKSAKAPVIIDTSSGAIASFEDGADGMPLKSLTVNIEPVQPGSGDPSPENVRPITGWTGCNVTRAGKNLFNNTAVSDTVSDIVFAVNSDGTVNASGTAASNAILRLGTITLPAGAYIINGLSEAGSATTWEIMLTTANYGSVVKHIYDTGGAALNVSTETTYGLQIIIRSGTTVNNMLFAPMIRFADETDDTYAKGMSNTCPIAFPSEAGTVYGGTLDVTNGVLTVDREIVDLGSLAWTYQEENARFYTLSLASSVKKPSSSSSIIGAISSIYAENSLPNYTDYQFAFASSGNLFVKDSRYTDANNFVTAVTGEKLVYPLATPIEITLTTTEITTLLGTNNIWADCGPVSVEYPADTKLYIDALTAPTEDDMIANVRIERGMYFMIGNTLYLSTTVIPAGDTIIPGTNCTKTNLAAALNALNT